MLVDERLFSCFTATIETGSSSKNSKNWALTSWKRHHQSPHSLFCWILKKNLHCEWSFRKKLIKKIKETCPGMRYTGGSLPVRYAGSRHRQGPIRDSICHSDLSSSCIITWICLSLMPASAIIAVEQSGSVLTCLPALQGCLTNMKCYFFIHNTEN